MKKSDNRSFVIGLIIGILVTLLLVAMVIVGVLLSMGSKKESKMTIESKRVEELLAENLREENK